MWCKRILDELGGNQMHENKALVCPELEFKCTLCGMVWNCLTNLDGKKHSALQNKCGGTWVKT